MKSITCILLLAVSLTLVRADLSCECGIENVSPRIIRGQEVSHVSRYPWMVFIKTMLQRGIQFGTGACTGSVINDRFILTAAHCLQEDLGVRMLSVNVFIGKHCKKEGFGLNEALPIKKYMIHERYRSAESFYDIGLIELAEPLKFNQTFSPICLPNFTGYDNFLAAGWGQKDGTPPYFGIAVKAESDCLREADLDVVDERTCQLFHPYLNRDKAFCAGGKTGVCQGDSGGPLMTRKDGNMYQVGITSFGREDCGIVTETPAIFEKVAAHYDWIRSKTQNAKWCKATRSAGF